MSVERRVTPASTPTVEIDYSGFADASQGNLAERLRVVWFPDCADDDRGCDPAPVPVEAVNDRERGVLSFAATQLTAPSVGGLLSAGVESLTAGGGGGSFGLLSSPSGASGSFQATPMATVLDYQVGLYTGSFDTSYPIAVPPPAAGAAPPVSLGYSSGSIDGMNTATNNQASSVGLGWSLGAGGSIQRHYETCGIANQAPGDLCPIGHEYTLTLNGTGSRLVKKSTEANYVEFRLQADPMWRVRKYDNGPSGHPDAHEEYWIAPHPTARSTGSGTTPTRLTGCPCTQGRVTMTRSAVTTIGSIRMSGISVRRRGAGTWTG